MVKAFLQLVVEGAGSGGSRSTPQLVLFGAVSQVLVFKRLELSKTDVKEAMLTLELRRV